MADLTHRQKVEEERQLLDRLQNDTILAQQKREDEWTNRERRRAQELQEMKMFN